MGYAFLSYSTKNQQAADAMRNRLRKEGIETWMAPGDIPAGSRYAQVINQAIKGCSCFVLILSDEDSDEVRKLIASVAASAGRRQYEERITELPEAVQEKDITVKVIGCGGCGCNTVERLYEQNRDGVRYVAVNSDLQALSTKNVDEKVYVRDEDELRDGKAAALIEGTDLMFITAGMGGNAGTNFSRVIAEAAHEKGVLTVGVIMIPFRFEGKRQTVALEGLERIRPFVDTLVVVYNDKLLSIVDRNATMTDALRLADQTLCQSINGISDLITKPGVVKLDFADLQRAMRGKGTAFIGTGIGSGEDRMIEAARDAIDNPLLETDIRGAGSVLINITGTSSMSVFDVNKASDLITEAAGPGTEVLFGTAVDDDMGNTVRVIIIATNK